MGCGQASLSATVYLRRATRENVYRGYKVLIYLAPV